MHRGTSFIDILRGCLRPIVLAALAAIVVPGPAQAEKRVALVIGNSAYQSVTRLDNPNNDARLIADTLKSLGFALVGNGAQVDLDKPALDRAVQAFGTQLAGADVALFYYAGHGVQVRGANYLVPVDANPTREADVDFQMLDTNLVLRQMEGSGTKLNLVILDACRNNPFGGRGLRAGDGGLAQMRAPEGTLISFATQPGNVARDGADGNSPYTKALAQTLRKPGLGIFETVNEVGLLVKRATGGAQEPWFSSSPIDGKFFFNAAPAAPAAVAPQVTATPPDEALWSMIKSSDVAALHEEFLRQFPGSVRAAEARARLDALKRSQVAVVAPPPPPPAAPPKAPAAAAPQPAALTPPSEPALGQLPWTASATDVAAWRLKATTRLGGALATTAVSLDRTSVAVTADREGSLHVLEARTLQPRAKITLSGYEKYTLSGIAILPPGNRVAVVRNGALEAYNVDSKTLVQSIPAAPGSYSGTLSLSRDGQRLYFVRAGSNPPRATVASYRIGPAGLTPEAEYPLDANIVSFDVSSDGKRFLVGLTSNDLILYDPGTRHVVWTQKCDCGARFGAGDRLAVFAGRPGASAGDFNKNSVIGVLDIASPERRVMFDAQTKESLSVDDVSPDGRLASIGSTNIGQVVVVPVSLDTPNLRPVAVLKDNSRQSIAGATFVGTDALVTMSSDNNARLWTK